MNLTLKAIISAVSGTALVCAFAPFSIWWLVFVSPLILYLLVYDLRPKNAFWIGLIFGLFYFGFGVPWTFNSIHEYGKAPVTMSAIISGSLVVVLSLFPALTCYIFSKVKEQSNHHFINVLIFSCLWALFEWSRSWVLTGFPWLSFGHVHHVGILQGVLPIFGVYGATWLSVVLCCLITSLYKGSKEQKIYAVIFYAVIGFLLVLSNLIQWTSKIGTDLDVVLVQGNISQEMKWDRNKHPFIMQKYKTLSEKHLDADVIVWPETAIPTYYSMVRETFLPELESLVEENDVEFLVGLFTYDQQTEQVFNSVMTVGDNTDFYSKQHLVPFGEYIPLRGLVSIFDQYIQLPMADISKGSGTPTVRLHDYDVGTSICYEVAYGEDIIKALPDAKYLINVSNDAWFGDSLAPHQHLEINQIRALETGRFLVRATNTGISAIINPSGDIVNRSAQFKEDVIRAKIELRDGYTPFSRWGNWGIVTILFSILLIILLTKSRRN